jgi:Coenzyme PQQ synthesis protein D (PqqD)
MSATVIRSAARDGAPAVAACASGACVTIAERVLTADIGDEIVLLMPDGGEYFALNATAAQLWRELRYGPIGSQVLIRHTAAVVSDRWGGVPAQIEAELADLVADLAGWGLLTCVAADGAGAACPAPRHAREN